MSLETDLLEATRRAEAWPDTLLVASSNTNAPCAKYSAGASFVEHANNAEQSRSGTRKHEIASPNRAQV